MLCAVMINIFILLVAGIPSFKKDLDTFIITSSVVTSLSIGTLICLLIIQHVLNGRFSVRLVRIIFICAAIFLLVVAGIVWILNATGVIEGSLTNPFTAAFTVLGVVFVFCQLALPSVSTNTNASVAPSEIITPH